MEIAWIISPLVVVAGWYLVNRLTQNREINNWRRSEIIKIVADYLDTMNTIELHAESVRTNSHTTEVFSLLNKCVIRMQQITGTTTVVASPAFADFMAQICIQAIRLATAARDLAMDNSNENREALVNTKTDLGDYLNALTITTRQELKITKTDKKHDKEVRTSAWLNMETAWKSNQARAFLRDIQKSEGQ